MKINLQPGVYIVAVSGGIDSVTLLHVLTQMRDLELVVAHFDHGIRKDSADDADFVRCLATAYKLPFETKRVELGEQASEATARFHRYEFLNEISMKHGADAIITAHHQDDVIETALLNTLRGTKRKGLVSLKSTERYVRPLTHVSKAQILDYAHQHKLEWVEDSTNKQNTYTRNRIRAIIKKSLTDEKAAEVVDLLNTISNQDIEINAVAKTIIQYQQPGQLDRNLIQNTDEPVAAELLASWLRSNTIEFDAKTIRRVITGVKSLQNSAQIDLKGDYYVELKRSQIMLKQRHGNRLNFKSNSLSV